MPRRLTAPGGDTAADVAGKRGRAGGSSTSGLHPRSGGARGPGKMARANARRPLADAERPWSLPYSPTTS
jgi:hypothetical protein